MNKKVLFTTGPAHLPLDIVVSGVLSGVTGRYTYDSIELMRSKWLKSQEDFDKGRFYRITFEEVDKEGNPIDG